MAASRLATTVEIIDGKPFLHHVQTAGEVVVGESREAIKHPATSLAKLNEQVKNTQARLEELVAQRDALQSFMDAEAAATA